MTVEKMLILLAILATATSLLTEGVKKFLDSLKVKYAANIVVLVVSIIIGGAGTIVFYMANGIAWTALNIVCIFIMIGLNWLGAMLGYDKVIQAITQMKSK